MCLADADLIFANTFVFAAEEFPFPALMIVTDFEEVFAGFMLCVFSCVNIILYYFKDDPFLPFLARLAD